MFEIRTGLREPNGPVEVFRQNLIVENESLNNQDAELLRCITSTEISIPIDPIVITLLKRGRSSFGIVTCYDHLTTC